MVELYIFIYTNIVRGEFHFNSRICASVCGGLCVCVCVRERERERECVCVCVCVCRCEWVVRLGCDEFLFCVFFCVCVCV